MKVLYEWLKEFVDLRSTPAELREQLSLAGIAIDAIDESPAGAILEADLTSNRPDALGHRGFAREIAALERTRLKPFEIPLTESGEKTASATGVAIQSPDLCGRYTARVLRGVRVGPSPDWMRKRLEALGQSSINNVVDATNYVMHELGHPLHAFDYDRLGEHRIVVRRARPGETMRTLDGIDRTLPHDCCVIADAGRAVAIGGIMGGEATEIGANCRNVLLESAWFDPISIRRTSKALGLRTEASVRFGRGADPEMAETASRRAAQLILEMAGGELLAEPIDIYPRPPESLAIELSWSELVRVMGAEVPHREIEAILGSLGFEPERVDPAEAQAQARWRCRQPSWRPDVAREIDLIEEVARHYGYHKFPSRLPPARQPASPPLHARALSRLRERLVALGYREIVAITLVDPARDELFRPKDAVPVRLANPLSEDASILRTSGIVSLISTLEWNVNRGQKDLRLFEIGRSYQLSPTGKPQETRVLTLGLTGLAREKSVWERKDEQPWEPAHEVTFENLKGDIDSLGRLCGGFAWQAGGPDWLAREQAARLKLALDVVGAEVGWAGQLAPAAAEPWKLRQTALIAQLELDPILEAIERARGRGRFRPIPRLPAVDRDFSLLLADGTTFAQVRDAVAGAGIGEIVAIAPVDLYRGGQVPAGKYSLLVRVHFQSVEETFTEPQLADFSRRIVESLETRLGATLRAK